MENIASHTRKWAVLALLLSFTTAAFADDPPPTPEDLERLAAIEAFTQRQIAANYPEKFKAAAEEFGVPVEILMGLSFAETRHEHLMWPEGERYSPENGMPRPYGIMSLWDNEFFGQSLIEAAKLIGQDPEVLKKDAFQNMRGGAALLKKYYDENPKPGYAEANSMESWKYALMKYSGLPEPDLAHQHAFDVYDWLRQGYDQYGIKLPEVSNLKLDEMWEETKKIKEEQRKINEEKWRAQGLMDDIVLEEFQTPDGMWHARPAGTKPEEVRPSDVADRVGKNKGDGSAAPLVAANTAGSASTTTWIAVIALSALIVGFLVFRKKQPQKK
jgi:hypothetical protein